MQTSHFLSNEGHFEKLIRNGESTQATFGRSCLFSDTNLLLLKINRVVIVEYRISPRILERLLAPPFFLTFYHINLEK